MSLDDIQVPLRRRASSDTNVEDGTRTLPMSRVGSASSLEMGMNPSSHEKENPQSYRSKTQARMRRIRGQKIITMYHLLLVMIFCCLLAAGVVFTRFQTERGFEHEFSSRHELALSLGATCRSDASCGSGNACLFGANESENWHLAPRPMDGEPGWVRTGTCVRDTKCTATSCNRNGQCVLGRGTCNYGWRGESCQQSTFAFVTLLYGTSTSVTHLLATATWARSLRNAGSKEDIIVAVTPEVPKAVREELIGQGLLVREIKPIALPTSMRSPFSRARWSSVFSKFRM